MLKTTQPMLEPGNSRSKRTSWVCQHFLVAFMAMSTFVGVTALLAGCGASGGQLTTGDFTGSRAEGRATVSVVWPTLPPAGRLIPAAANSISVRVTSADGATLLGSGLLTRPAAGGTASVSFDHIPVGAVLLTASAYPNSNGTGVAQAVGQVAETVKANQTTPFNLTLSSTIAHVGILLPESDRIVGQIETLGTGATDASGNIVLVGSGTLQWNSSATAVATVDASGVVTAVGAGTTTLTVTETESGKSASAVLTVTPPTPVVYDEFDDKASASLDGQAGGYGWYQYWYALPSSGVQTAILPQSLAYQNLQTSGGALQMSNSQAHGADRLIFPPLGGSGQVIYISGLVKPLAAGSAAAPSIFTFGTPDLSVGLAASDSHLGIQASYLGLSASSSVVPQVGVTYFLVVRETFSPTAETADLFINPPLNQPLPATPDATLTMPASAIAEFEVTANNSCAFDEFRIGNSFAAVAPTQ